MNLQIPFSPQQANQTNARPRIAVEPRNYRDFIDMDDIESGEHNMDAILATVSHELVSPLNVIGGSIQLAERGLRRVTTIAAPDQQQLDAVLHLLNVAHQQVGRMNRLVADLRDSAGIQFGKLQICLEPADLAELVMGVVAEQRLVHPHRVFNVQLPKREGAIVRIDADRITQVLTNYVTNAVKYTPTERPIDIRLHVFDSALRVSVRDYGPGLAPAQQERIWERFHQIQEFQEERGAVTGLGLGLHISRAIVEQHHGCVGVESVEGQGANFWFEIPFSVRKTQKPGFALDKDAQTSRRRTGYSETQS